MLKHIGQLFYVWVHSRLAHQLRFVGSAVIIRIRLTNQTASNVMEELLLILNQPPVLWTIFTASILAVLIDYLFPVDWLAYVGYALFAIFVGATAPISAAYSVAAMIAVFGLMLMLHKFMFAKFLTNAPHCYCHTVDEKVADDAH